MPSRGASRAPLRATPLQSELADRIAALMHEEGVKPGTRINENAVALRLGVSRTPVRAALDVLAARGFAARRPNKGVELLKLPPQPRAAPARTSAPPDEDALLVRIARERQRGELPAHVSEKELMDRYGLSRPALRLALDRLAELGVVERRLGYGWQFAAEVWDQGARQESYRFRMTVEPAAIREPGFALAPEWIAQMRGRHEAFLKAPWTDSSSIAFFEMNAAFHEGIAQGSRNRYFALAVQRQNRLRRLSNYDWKHGRERVEVNCREHLEMLDRLQAGDCELAALLMHRHLEVASRLRAQAQAA
ncbi:MAG TPA: GntR family transcriptional regulator [Ramlibacter sp.]|uniref:GntR family transcriptional regulator n=1 Tax=Ramlibacter sp. TaxID=1917967 RepID=UPI002CEFB911|nr:GntR family transcriptional regulator [Ramlibacter sp.]HVZ44472.1 GntR family transcriptional regulator [Ramlibacter sp.]